MKFRRALMSCFLIFSLVPMYLLGSIAIWHNNSMMERIITDSLETISQAQIVRIKDFCESRRQNLHLIGETEIVQDALLVSLGEKSPEETTSIVYVNDFLEERCSAFEFLNSVSLVDRNYILVASSDPSHVAGSNSALRNSRENHLRNDFYMGACFERPKKDGSTIQVIPVYESVYMDDQLLGYLVEEIPITYFDKFRYELDLALGCTMYLTDYNENIITAGTSSAEEDVRKIVTTPEERREYSERWDAIDWETNPTGSFSYTVNDVKYITSYSSIPYTDWRVCISADLSVFYQTSFKFQFALLSAIGLMTVCLFACNVFFSRWLSRPIEEIMTVLRKVRENNDYTLRVEYESPDEFGQLSKQLNSLLEYAEEMRIIEEQQKLSLQNQVVRDPLTDLYNKTAVKDQIDQLLEKAGDQQIAIGFVDLDNFRDYNNLYGHIVGDQALKFMANTMKTTFGDGTGRNGGDEFLFWMVHNGSDESLRTQIQNFLDTMNEGFYSETEQKKLPVACSIGVAIEKASSTNTKQLILHADYAMYRAKNAGKNNICILHQ